MQMFVNCDIVEENVVLRTHAQVFAYFWHAG